MQQYEEEEEDRTASSAASSPSNTQEMSITIDTWLIKITNSWIVITWNLLFLSGYIMIYDWDRQVAAWEVVEGNRV